MYWQHRDRSGSDGKDAGGASACSCGKPHMASRTTQTVVHFSSAFRLPGFDEPQPAGDYRVDHDEESIEGISRLAWRRVGAFIHLPGNRPAEFGATDGAAQPGRPRCRSRKGPWTTMTAPSFMQRNRPIRRDTAKHLFTIGQAVRLKAGFGTLPKSSGTSIGSPARCRRGITRHSTAFATKTNVMSE